MPFALRPVAPVGIPAGPGVHAYYLKTVRPGAGVLPLALGSGAYTVSMGFSILPTPAISAAVVEIKPSARHSDTKKRSSPGAHGITGVAQVQWGNGGD